MKVFVTGATGFVGQEILRQLHGAGRSIRLLAREPQSARVQKAVSSYRAEVHNGNVLEPGSLKGALDGMHAIIHLAGVISEFGENTFENVHTRGTQNLVAAAQEAGVERFIHMSALGTRPHAVSRYHQTKWAAEEVVRQSDLDYTIFRPSLIFGPGDRFVNLFARLIRFSPVLPILAADSARFQPVAVEAVGAALVVAIAGRRSMGQTCDLCGPEALTLAEIVDEICGAMGRRRFKVRVPLAFSRRQAAFLEFIFPRLFRRAAPLNRDQLIMLQEDNLGDPRPANKMFGLSPVPFRAGIAKYVIGD